jgi:hypothetical protein
VRVANAPTLRMKGDESKTDAGVSLSCSVLPLDRVRCR